jgi:DNA polymerase-4
MPLNVLIKYAGRAALQLHERARGIDDQPVTAGHTIQSIGHEETFMHDLTGIDQARTELLALSMKTAARMRKHGMSGKTVTLKATYSDFRKISRSHTATACFSDNSSIYKTCCRLLAKTDIEHTPVRLLGVSISNLRREGSQRQVCLFDDYKQLTATSLSKAIDDIHAKFGCDMLLPARLYSRTRYNDASV